MDTSQFDPAERTLIPCNAGRMGGGKAATQTA